MFLDELTPLLRELLGHPIAFAGGFASGLLRLNLADDPVKSWLDQQSGGTSYVPPHPGSPNGKSSGPQSILIE
jgi:hypothetical protein